MKHRVTFVMLLAALSGPVIAQPPAQPVSPPASVPQQKLVRVALVTSQGTIVLDLDAGRAPITTANFLRYVDQKRYDGASFYRAMRITPTFGVVQGGWYKTPGHNLPPIAHEPTTKTGLRHTTGTISMGRFAPGTAVSEFFITLSDMPAFDADPSKPGDNQGYAAFGKVVEGMDVIRKIYDAPISATKGDGGMRGQIIEAPIKIISATRVKVTMPAAVTK